MGFLSQLFRAATPENPRFNLNSSEAWDAFGVPASSSGARITRKSALTFPAFWRGVNLIANAVAKTPIHIYRREGEGKVRATEHAGYRLLRHSPIPDRVEATAFDWKRIKMGHVLTKGNGYSYILRDAGGDPYEFLLLDPEITTPVRENGQLLYVTQVNGEWRRLCAENVLHWKGLGWDGLIGYDVLTIAAEALGEGIAKQKHSAKFFANHARPGVVIEVPTPMKEGPKKEMLDGWNRMHTGLDAAHRTAILDHGAKISKFQVDAEKAQLLESRKFSRVDMALILGVAPHKLGDDATTSNGSLEQESQSFLDDGIDPWFCMIEAEGREKVLTEEEKAKDTHTVEFLRESLVSVNLDAKTNSIARATGGRPWMTVNEARARFNLNPDSSPDSDKLLTPLNMGQGGLDNKPQNPNDPQPGNPKNNGITSGVKAAVEEMVHDAALRVVRRASSQAQRAAKEPGKYLAWLDTFAGEQLPTVAEMLAPSAKAVSALHGKAIAPEVAGADILEAIRLELSAVADKSPASSLARKVDHCLSRLEIELPAAFARQLMGE